MDWGDQVEVTVAGEALGAIPDLFLLQGQSTGLPHRPTDRLPEESAMDTRPRGLIEEREELGDRGPRAQ